MSDLCDLPRLMIASKDCDSLTETNLNRTMQLSVERFADKDYLESYEQADGFNTVVASVNIVPHEEIIGIGALASDPEQLHQVMELAVHIATNCNWAFHLKQKTRIVNGNFPNSFFLLTSCTLLSFARISLAFSQRLLT